MSQREIDRERSRWCRSGCDLIAVVVEFDGGDMLKRRCEAERRREDGATLVSPKLRMRRFSVVNLDGLIWDPSTVCRSGWRQRSSTVIANFKCCLQIVDGSAQPAYCLASSRGIVVGATTDGRWRTLRRDRERDWFRVWTREYDIYTERCFGHFVWVCTFDKVFRRLDFWSNKIENMKFRTKCLRLSVEKSKARRT